MLYIGAAYVIVKRLSVCLSVWLPVCWSVTYVYCTCRETAKHILKLFSPSGSIAILVLPYAILWRNSYGSRNGGLERWWVRFSTNILIYLGNANRNSYTIYRIVPISVASSDPWPRFQGYDILQRQRTRQRQKIQLYLQWQTDRKSYMIYWMVPFFSDHEWSLTQIIQISRARHFSTQWRIYSYVFIILYQTIISTISHVGLY